VAWASRVLWLAVAVLGGAAISDALDGRSRSIIVTATILLWAGWALCAMALMVPSVIALTVVRVVVPIAIVVAVLASTAASAVNAAVCVGLSATTALVVASAEFGQWMVQSSAYGDERRFPMRPPTAFVLPTLVSWAVMVTGVIAGPLALAARNWWLGIPMSAAAIGLVWFLAPRFHRLSRRWVVLVPAGFVVHDHVVLAETVMIPSANIASVALAAADSEAADLTGPAIGSAVNVTLISPATVLRAPTRDRPTGTALHVRSLLVAPSRPGRLLEAWAPRAGVR
jgi:hypothetical protein